MMALTAFIPYDPQSFILMNINKTAPVHSNIIKGFLEMGFFTLKGCAYGPPTDDLTTALNYTAANLFDATASAVILPGANIYAVIKRKQEYYLAIFA